MTTPSIVSFERWLDAYFSESIPLSTYEPAEISLPREELLLHFRTLLSAPGKHLLGYTSDHLRHGLDALFNGSYLFHDEFHVLLDPALSHTIQLEALSGIFRLFSEVFAPLCEPGDSRYAHGKLDPICYMFWDIFPTWGGESSHVAHNREILGVMEQCLRLESAACIESAIHGLNHWVHNHQEDCHRILDDFLARSRKVPLSATVIQNVAWAKKGEMP